MPASRKADRQLCTCTYLASGSYHSPQQTNKVSLTSIYICITVH